MLIFGAAPAAAARKSDRRDVDPVFGVRGLHAGLAVVLVVEDDDTNRLIITRQLRRMGVPVRSVVDGHLAVAAVREHRYAAILMDCRLPTVDGFEATARIRQLESPGDERIPIIGYTANAVTEYIDRCFAVGMDGVLAKPATSAEIHATLDPFLGLSPDEQAASAAA